MAEQTTIVELLAPNDSVGALPLMTEGGVETVDRAGYIRELTKTVCVRCLSHGDPPMTEADYLDQALAMLDANNMYVGAWLYNQPEHRLGRLALEERRARIRQPIMDQVMTDPGEEPSLEHPEGIPPTYEMVRGVLVDVTLIYRRQHLVPELVDSGSSFGFIESHYGADGQPVLLYFPGTKNANPGFAAAPAQAPLVRRPLAQPYLIFEWCEVTDTPEQRISALVGKVNHAPWRGYDAHTWLCTSITPTVVRSDISGDRVRIFRFRATVENRSYYVQIPTTGGQTQYVQVGWGDVVMFRMDGGRVPTNADQDSVRLVRLHDTADFGFFDRGF